MAREFCRRGGALACLVRWLRGCVVFALLGLSSLTHATIVNYQSTLNDGSTKPAHMALMSANGVDMYVPQLNDLAIAHYKWDAALQKLTFTSSYQEGSMSGGKTIGGLNRPWQVSLSPDQRHLYVISSDTTANPTDTTTLTLFERSTTSGALVFTAAYANNVGGITGITAPTALTQSADGLSLYITSTTEQTLTVFRVDADSGQLPFVNSLKHGTNPDGLDNPSAVVPTPDGRFVYVTDANANLVAIYARDVITGALTFKSTAVLGGSPNNMIVSRDGSFLYITLPDKNSIATFARDTITGALKLVTTLSNNTNAVTALVNPYSLTMSADDTKLFVGTLGNNSLVVFRRQPMNGVLTLIEEHVGPELNGVFGNVITPQGGNLMTVGAEPVIGLYDITTNDLRVTVTPPATLPAQGQTATYQYDIKEVSGIAGATKLALSARIPDGLDITPATPSQGACAQANKVLSCEFGVINANGSILLKLALTPQQAAPMRFEVLVFAEQVDTQPSNNIVRVSLPYVAPVAQNDEVIFVLDPKNADLSQDIDVLANDSGATSDASLTIIQFDSPSLHGAVKLSNGKLTYQPNAGYTGIDTFKYTMQDGAGNKAAPATVTVFVDTPPVAIDDQGTVDAGKYVDLRVINNDLDVNFATAGFNEVLSVVAVESPNTAGATAVILDGGRSVTYTAPNDFIGEDTFTYTIEDRRGGRSTATIRVNVTSPVTAQQQAIDVPVVQNKHKKGGALDAFAVLALLLALTPRILPRKKPAAEAY